MNTLERHQHKITTRQIQANLEIMRLAYRERGMEPLNRRRRPRFVTWFALGMAIATTLILAALI